MQSQAHILVVDSDEGSQTLLQLSLQQAGYTVQIASTGQAALDLYAAHPSDLVLLDVLLPDMDGFAVCVELRKRSHVPIVMLTVLNRTEDIVQGLNLGADDYIAKPYRISEIAVRLQAVLQRSMRPPAYQILAVPDLLVNDTLHEVWVRGALVQLTFREYQLLRHLMSQPNSLFSKIELYEMIWGDVSTMNPNVVEVTMRRLREKIEVNPSKPRFLRTVRGGYLFKSPPLAIEAGYAQ